MSVTRVPLELPLLPRPLLSLSAPSVLRYGRRHTRAVEVSPIPPTGAARSRPRRRQHHPSPPDPAAQYQSYWNSLNVGPAVKFMLAHVPSDGDVQSQKSLGSLETSSPLPPRARLARPAREDVLAAKEKIRSCGRPRDGPRPKVVTLELPGGPRLGRHLEESLAARGQQQSTVSSGESSRRSPNSGAAGPTLPTIVSSEGSVAETTTSSSKERRHHHHGNGETKRAMLKGYKQLQVFGELRGQGERTGTERESRLIEIPAEPKKYLPPTRAPVYKLDLRHRRRLTSQGALLPQLTDTELKLASSPLLSMAPQRKETTAISIRFEDGKVILSRNNTTLEEEQHTPGSGGRAKNAGGEIAGDSLQVNPGSEGEKT